MGGNLIMKAPAETAIVPGVTCATEVTVRMSPARTILRAAYPCDCRSCKELARAAGERQASRLAAVDVYDLPDGAVESPSAYFH